MHALMRVMQSGAICLRPYLNTFAVIVQIRFLTDERAVQADDLARATAKAEHLETQLSQARAELHALRAALVDAQKQADSSAAAMQALMADKVLYVPMESQLCELSMHKQHLKADPISQAS